MSAWTTKNNNSIVTTLNQVCKIVGGLTLPIVIRHSEDGIKFFNVKDYSNFLYQIPSYKLAVNCLPNNYHLKLLTVDSLIGGYMQCASPNHINDFHLGLLTTTALVSQKIYHFIPDETKITKLFLWCSLLFASYDQKHFSSTTTIKCFYWLRRQTEIAVWLPNHQLQLKIGDFFAKFMKLIQLSQKIIETLQRLKRYLLQLFIQYGFWDTFEENPNLELQLIKQYNNFFEHKFPVRFVKHNSLSLIGKDNESKSTFNDQGYLVANSAGIDDDWSLNYQYYQLENVNQEMRRQFVLAKHNQIFVHIVNFSAILFDQKRFNAPHYFCKNFHCLTIKSTANEIISPRFLYLLLIHGKATWFNRLFAGTGSTFGTYMKPTILWKINFALPLLSEQKQIGVYFENNVLLPLQTWNKIYAHLCCLFKSSLVSVFKQKT